MELTLENLVNEIVKQEYWYRMGMLDAKEIFGEDHEETRFWRSKWSAFYNLASKFGFTNKLKRKKE